MKKLTISLLFVLTVISIDNPYFKLKKMIPTKKEYDTMNQQLIDAGITNQKVRIALIAQVNTEGSFKLVEEFSYRNTNVSRLRKVFGKRLDNYTNEQLDTIKKDDVAFYEIIYGGRYGNSQYGDGFKYRGRGYNQITFKGAYEKYGKMLGLDLVSNPELLNKPEIALKAYVAYYIDQHDFGQRTGLLKKKFNVTHWDQLTKQEDYNRLICQINGGWGTNIYLPVFADKIAKIDAISAKITKEYAI